MKKFTLALTVTIFAVLVVVALDGIRCQGQSAVKAADSLPASLDSHYPPAAPGPVYLVSMHEMADPLSGVAVDLFEGDPADARVNFESFKAKYVEVSKMVPEWESYYPMAPVDQLAAAMESEDPGEVMGAIDNIGKTCNNCHYRYMVPVQHKYHWGEFDILTVSDPVTGSDYPFAVFKHMMETDMVGIGIDMGQGQRENALDRLNGFEQRFTAFKEVCAACHDSQRKYYVDESVTAMIAGIRAKLNEATIDPRAVGELLQGIGQESCFKCHLVHTPAAYAKYQAGN